jgi:hypothetical protein
MAFPLTVRVVYGIDRFEGHHMTIDRRSFLVGVSGLIAWPALAKAQDTSAVLQTYERTPAAGLEFMLKISRPGRGSPGAPTNAS